MKQHKRQIRAKRKAKIQRIARMHAQRGGKKGGGQSITRSKFCFSDAR